MLQLRKDGENLLSAFRIVETGDWRGIIQSANRSAKPSHGFFTAANDFDGPLNDRLDIEFLLWLTALRDLRRGGCCPPFRRTGHPLGQDCNAMKDIHAVNGTVVPLQTFGHGCIIERIAASVG